MLATSLLHAKKGSVTLFLNVSSLSEPKFIIPVQKLERKPLGNWNSQTETVNPLAELSDSLS